MRAANALLASKGAFTQAEGTGRVPHFSPGTSTNPERLTDNHVCQIQQKVAGFKPTKGNVEHSYITDLGDKITVGLVKESKWVVYIIVSPRVGSTFELRFIES